MAADPVAADRAPAASASADCSAGEGAVLAGREAVDPVVVTESASLFVFAAAVWSSFCSAVADAFESASAAVPSAELSPSCARVSELSSAFDVEPRASDVSSDPPLAAAAAPAATAPAAAAPTTAPRAVVSFGVGSSPYSASDAAARSALFIAAVGTSA
ncbi:hypothetical protein [Nocardia sp. NPDC058114]|uniref:hypothetical protein n=1 Tax=Nocardia sp. NPDC058114 TaxID=3346346 RepID=UPI0036DF6544